MQAGGKSQLQHVSSRQEACAKQAVRRGVQLPCSEFQTCSCFGLKVTVIPKSASAAAYGDGEKPPGREKRGELAPFSAPGALPFLPPCLPKCLPLDLHYVPHALPPLPPPISLIYFIIILYYYFEPRPCQSGGTATGGRK